MRINKVGPWVYYVTERSVMLLSKDAGKWMYFFDNNDGFIADICKKAVESGVVAEAKHSDDIRGVACFYVNGDDVDGHKKIIKFFLDNKMIPYTKSGKLKNISFKFNVQTRAGEYGEEFKSQINLEKFLNLTTGEWKI